VEVRRAYRRLAQRFHPDVNPDPRAATRFSQIQRAYATLSSTGPTASRHAGPGGDARRRRGARAAEARVRNSSHLDAADDAEILAPVRLTLKQACRGARLRLTLNKHPNGRRAVSIRIPAGVADGDLVRLPGLGATTPDGSGREVFLPVRLAPRRGFAVDGRDLHRTLPVSPWVAALGACLPVWTPAGLVDVDIPPTSSSGRRIRVPRRGLPNPTGRPGDLVVKLRIVLPPTLSRHERAAYERLADAAAADTSP
jgi:curved DNA-binding protein